MRLILAVDHAFQKASRRVHAATGLTGPQSLVIRIVGRFPGLSAGHLARLLHVHPSTITGIVRRLERQKLIRRQTDPRDRRRAFLGLTSGGRQLDARLAGTIEAALETVLAGMAPEEIRSVGSVLGRVIASLDRANRQALDSSTGPAQRPAGARVRAARSPSTGSE